MKERADFLQALRLLPGGSRVSVPAAAVKRIFPCSDLEDLTRHTSARVWVSDWDGKEQRTVIFEKKEVARG